MPENSPPPQDWTSTFWCWVRKSYAWKQLSPKIPSQDWTSTFWCWVRKSYTWKQPPPRIELLLFDAVSKNHIPENMPLHPPRIELLLFDAVSKNHMPENTPPPQDWTSTFWCWVWKSYAWKQPPPPGLDWYFLMLSLKIICLKTAPPPPPSHPPGLNCYFLMLSPKIICLKTHVVPLWRLIKPGG